MKNCYDIGISSKEDNMAGFEFGAGDLVTHSPEATLHRRNRIRSAGCDERLTFIAVNARLNAR